MSAFSHRLRLLALAAAAVGACTAPAAAPAAATAAADSAAPLSQSAAQRIGHDAYRYGIALMEFLREERTQTSVTVPDQAGDAPLDQLGNGRALANPSEQIIVQPNNDTLYSSAHLDLGHGPMVLHVPAVPHHRYYSFEFMDPYTNVFGYVGTRTTGDGAGTFLLAGPGYRGATPQGMRRIRSPYNLVWMLGRTLVYGPSDLPAVHRIQDGYRLIPLTQYRARGLAWKPPRPRHVVTKITRFGEPTGLAFFDALGRALARSRPPARDAAILAEMRQAGIGPGLMPSREHLPSALVAGLRAAVAGGPADVAQLKTSVATQSVVATHGWFIPPPDTGDYGTDYDLRAVVALNGLAANRPAEAMYIVGITDPSLTRLNGAHTYRIHFAAGKLPPARYFWSLTMYNAGFYLVPNAEHRYEIGNRTPGLHYNPDGSLDIYLAHGAPAGHRSNWLPAPIGTFMVTLRLYGPRASALHRTYTYPPITRLS